MRKTQVLIAGGGPVGMTLALELARYGVRSILVERNATTTRHPKMDLTNGRSMELFRRLGIVDRLREAGVPPDNPFDISWITHLTGDELYRFRYPSSKDYLEKSVASNDGSWPAEAPLRVSQIDIEPVLKLAIDSNSLVEVRFGTRFESIVEHTSDKVVAQIANESTGETEHIQCEFLAGCDGGGSRVRRHIGIELQGELDVASAYMVHFHSTDVELLQRWGVTWHYQNGAGTLIAQNDKDTWTLQAWLPPGDDGSTWVADQVLETWIGKHFDYTILQANPWSAHFVVAERYQAGQVLLAGDSAHQFIPTGGYGMNSGIADAIGLAWVLAASIEGWGGPRLLEGYDIERRQTAWWHLEASKRHMRVRLEMAELYSTSGDIYSDDPEAVSRREVLAGQIAELGNAENESWGVELGYCYEASPLIHYEGTQAQLDPIEYLPTTQPGMRCPHVFVEHGVSVHDLLGTHFTLLIIGVNVIVPEQSTLGDTKIPLKLLHLEQSRLRDIFQANYVLVRPDQHVAWRGDVVTDAFPDILAKAAGW